MRNLLICGALAPLFLTACASTPTTEQQVAQAHALHDAIDQTCKDKGYKPESQDFQTCVAVEQGKAINATTSSNLNNALGTHAVTGLAAGAMAAPLLLLSDARAKTDIVPVGVQNGLKLYRFRYRSGSETYVGVLAQEVAHLRPDAVRTDDRGYLRVNYAALGITMMTWDNYSRLHGLK